MTPLSPRAARTLLLVIGAAFCALAVNASVLLPLWEPAGEFAHWQVIAAWARTARPPDPAGLPPTALPAARQPPLAAIVSAAGAHALGIADTEFLVRRDVDAERHSPLQYLHGADEVFPFRGPARRLHLLRLLNVLCGLGVVLGCAALARRLLPECPAAWAGAAALVAFQPAFIAACAGLGNEPLAMALGTLALLPLAELASAAPAGSREQVQAGAVPGARSHFGTGVVLGLALLAGWSAAFLLALLPLALWLRRTRGAAWRETLRPADAIVAGILVVTGPFLAWQLADGDAFARSVRGVTPAGARDAPAIAALAAGDAEEFLRGWVARLSGRVYAGPPVVIAWSCVIGGALLCALRWLPWRRLRARRAARRARAQRDTHAAAAAAAIVQATRTTAALDGARLRVAALLAAAVLLCGAVNAAPCLPAFACLLALAWCRLPRWAGLAGGTALAALAFRVEVHELGPALWPPQRIRDAHFMAFDPLAQVAPEQRLSTLALLAPPDNSRHVTPPTLRWALPANGDTRFTVHLSVPGMRPSLHSAEDDGVSVRDRYTIPDAWWYALPPGVPLDVQVLKLPTLDEALAARDGALDVVQSAVLTLRRLPGPAPPSAAAGAAAAAR